MPPKKRSLIIMALTRKFLTAMGLTAEQVDSIIEAHTGTVDGLKEQLNTAKEKATKLDDVQKELDALKAKGGEDYKDKYEKEHKAFEDFKKEQTAKETRTAKETAVKAYFESKGITGANLTIAMRGAKDEVNAIELDGDKIKDAKALDDLIAGEYAGLVVTKKTTGAQTAKPPATNTSSTIKTKEDIYKKDEHGRYLLDTNERQRALSELLASGQR